MQDEINEKTIALYIKTGKLTAQTLQNNDKSRVGADRKQLPQSPVRYRFSRLSDYGMCRHLCGFGKQHDYSG